MCPTAPGQPLPPYTPSTPTAPEIVVLPTQYVMVTGALTDGTNPVVFPHLRYYVDYSGKPSFQSIDLPPVSGVYGIIVWDTNHWSMRYFDGLILIAEWRSSEDVASPELVETWTAQGDATGDPVVTNCYSASTAPATVAPASPGNAPSAPGAALGSGPGNAPSAPGSVTPVSPTPTDGDDQVRYVAQTPTAAEKLIALANIGAQPATSIDVRTYGAKFDNSTDDTAAIQAALDAAAAATGIAEVILPPGTAVISSPLLVKGRDGLLVRGAGPVVTTIRATGDFNAIQYRKPINGQLHYLEWLTLADFSVIGVGIPNSTATGLHLHDNTTADDLFNGGSLKLRNLRIGANGTGFHTGLFLKRWDTFVIENCRFLYNYRNARLESFTKTGTILNGGNAQAESVLWDFGPGARVNMIGVDNGNAPQWMRISDGATVTALGCNFETQRYSTAATRRFNYSTSTYPTVANITAISGTGVFTTGAAHGFKPGIVVSIGCTGSPTALPSPLSYAEVYEVSESDFTATTFTLLPTPRPATTAVGNASITIGSDALRTNFSDLAVGQKVRITTQGIDGTVIAYTGGSLSGGSRLPDAEYWIVEKPDANTIRVSETQSGTAIVFQTAASVRIRPVSPIVPATLGSGMTACAPAIGMVGSAGLTEVDCQHTANSGVPFAVLGIGSTYSSAGTWHTSGYTTSGLTGQAATLSALVSGRVFLTGQSSVVDGYNIPVANRGASVDGGIVTYNTMRKMVNNSDSGYGGPSQAGPGRTAFHWVLGKDGTTGLNDRAFAFVRDARGLYGPEPFLNRDAVRTIAVTSSTFATYSELKPRQKYRVDHSSASGTLTFNLPDNSTAGTYSYDGTHTDERISVDDEIEVMVVGANGQTVQIQQGTASGTIRLNSSTVTTAGTTHGVSLVAGESVRLKCTYSSGTNVSWQVVGAVGSPGTF